MKQFTLRIANMTCSHCERAVTNIIKDVKGVEEVKISLKDHTVTVSGHDPLSQAEVIEEVNKSGVYIAHVQ